MKQITILIVLLVVEHVQSYVPNSHETIQSEDGRKRMLVNLLHALRTLRDHKKVKSTNIIFPKIHNIHSDKVRENYISPESNFTPQIGKSINKVRPTRQKNQLTKRSKGIHGKAKGAHEKKHRNGKELFLQLLQTLRGLRIGKNAKRSRRINLPKKHDKQVTKETQVTEEGVKTLMSQRQSNRWPDFDERSNVLKPVKQVAKIGMSQTNKARYSFAQARMSFLEALETAQDEKLSRLGNLGRRFSYILPEKEENNHMNEMKRVGHTLQNFSNDQSATTLSHVHRPYKDLATERSQTMNPTKLSILGKPFSAISSSPASTRSRFESKGNAAPSANVDKKSMNNGNISKAIENHSKELKRRKELFLDELLSISNAHSKFEKLKRLEKLKEKLLRKFAKDKTIKNEDNGRMRDDNAKENLSSHSYQGKINRPIIQKGGNQAFHMKNYPKSSRVVSGKPNKRYNERQRPFKGGNQNNSIAGIGLPVKVGSTNQRQIASPVGYADSSQGNNKPIYSSFVPESYASLTPLHENRNTSENTSSLYDENHHEEAEEIGYNNHPAPHASPKLQNLASASLPRKTSNSASILNTNALKDDGNHRRLVNAAVLEENQTTNALKPVVKNERNSHDVNTIGTAPLKSEYLSTKSKNGSESDHSYLPLDSSATAAQRNEGEDLKNSLSSVVTEHDKIISELTKSKALSNQMSSDKNRTEKSHKTLSKILQKAQNIFLKKVKEILAGNKKNDKEDDNTKLESNKGSGNFPEKLKEGVINTSAYVMDESPHEEKAATKMTPSNSGIVPKTPTNDELLNSVNRNLAQPAVQQQNSGINSPMESLQTPMDHTPPLQTQSVGQQGPGNPVAGQPLTYSQLQDAHEEERVAMQQENVFRTMQPGASLPSNNGVNSPINSATMPSQRYMGANELPQTSHYPTQNQGFAPNVDDLSEYRGGMERYQLSHRLGYHEDLDDVNEDDYLPRRHLHFNRHRFDDEDDYDDDDDDVVDDDEDSEDFDEDGDKKSKIGKPRHVTDRKKHSKKHNFRKSSNSTKLEHKKHEKGHVNGGGR